MPISIKTCKNLTCIPIHRKTLFAIIGAKVKAETEAASKIPVSDINFNEPGISDSK